MEKQKFAIKLEVTYATVDDDTFEEIINTVQKTAHVIGKSPSNALGRFWEDVERYVALPENTQRLDVLDCEIVKENLPEYKKFEVEFCVRGKVVVDAIAEINAIKCYKILRDFAFNKIIDEARQNGSLEESVQVCGEVAAH